MPRQKPRAQPLAGLAAASDGAAAVASTSGRAPAKAPAPAPAPAPSPAAPTPTAASSSQRQEEAPRQQQGQGVTVTAAAPWRGSSAAAAAPEAHGSGSGSEEVDDAAEGNQLSDRPPDWDPWSDPEVVRELEAQDIPVLPELCTAQHVIVRDGFLTPQLAGALRGVFDGRFADPRATHPERFVWDYWHVPDQYTLIRTQAAVYFPDELYAQLEDALLSYGETQLGCRAISPIWMSYYVDGCGQELHCDNPHGPFAFVLSLTMDWDKREFVGGETMILKPEVLNYWRSFDPRKGLELQHLVTRVPSPFNRLTVFDPRFPHGVRQVHGTRDPRKGRLVLHGWFTEPAPFFSGPLDPAEAAAALSEGLEPLWAALEAVSGLVSGTLISRVTISGATGAVTDLTWLADTLVEVPNHDRAAAEALLEGRVLPRLRALVQGEVKECLMGLTFPAAESGEDSHLTLPLVFE
ncbi:hypothetical protein HYH03_002870 [Edaphochlamys debaryana]|uniref:Fe2OG dioxygenase domain-containing protein n=1 Tax=Edaphochlamys debaryana TaxID=47281 RepID=A0A835YAF1_9CHLO|nr:hypothetical protein HYH03_002870 [Edaphochlamys debaryana]|eukprot:KAG2499292.1 hypothetical protein HYH03_002870 [Edaphochlamys debaryana]